RAEGELAHALGAARQAPGAQEGFVRVDAHAHRSVLGHDLGQPGAEHHAPQPCRLGKSKVEPRTTSREVTAPGNPARVVIAGTELAAAASRISSPSARSWRPEGTLMTMSMVPAAR